MSKAEVRIICAVLAGGRSTRMGGLDKRLLPWGGATLLEHSVANALASTANHVIVVTRTLPDEVRARLLALDLTLVENEALGEAMSASVKQATRQAQALGATHVVYALADMPMVTKSILDALMDGARHHPLGVIRACHGGEAGNPVVLPLVLFADDLLALEGDKGARSILKLTAHPVMDIECGPGVLSDIDTPADYEALLGD